MGSGSLVLEPEADAMVDSFDNIDGSSSSSEQRNKRNITSSKSAVSFAPTPFNKKLIQCFRAVNKDGKHQI